MDYGYVYQMDWFESKRHRNSWSTMYFMREEDTRWGHDDTLVKISVLRCDKNSQEYDSAWNNSIIRMAEEMNIDRKLFVYCKKDFTDFVDYMWSRYLDL